MPLVPKLANEVWCLTTSNYWRPALLRPGRNGTLQQIVKILRLSTLVPFKDDDISVVRWDNRRFQYKRMGQKPCIEQD